MTLYTYYIQAFSISPGTSLCAGASEGKSAPRETIQSPIEGNSDLPASISCVGVQAPKDAYSLLQQRRL